ncbi:MAG: hypothetical protein WDW36_001004 [Sanguina aurantia]
MDFAIGHRGATLHSQAKGSNARTSVRAQVSSLIIPTPELVIPKYCESTHQTRRRPTRTVHVGPVKIGSQHRVALQTMTTTDTRNVQATVDQVKKCADAGADIVRITVQGKKEAEACYRIREQLFKDKYDTPLVADIHFQPAVAMMVAECFEKIRINPGNFADGRKTFEEFNYEDPAGETRHAHTHPGDPSRQCKELGRAMRIGTNHGSLSARILSYYGDTPRGMVESAFEFVNVARKHDYHNFVFSMKASNPLVMVSAYRLLAEEMYNKGWDYPLHLGVTEAGEGEDGRMKSAIGIGALLMDGLGDTIRVSLTEDPEFEIDPCRKLAQLGEKAASSGLGVAPFEELSRDTHSFSRRVGELPKQQESDGDKPEHLYKKLGAKLSVGMPFKDIATSDSVLLRQLPAVDDKEGRRALRRLQEVTVHVIAPAAELARSPLAGAVALHSLKDALAAHSAGGVKLPEGSLRLAIEVDGTESDSDIAALATLQPVVVLLNTAHNVSRLHASRRVFESLKSHNIHTPVIHNIVFPPGTSRDDIVISTGSVVGGLLVDGLGDGACIEAPHEDLDFLRTTSFGLLQGSRMRNTKTEYVSCPSCGRTLFNLQEVTEEIRQRTGHLPGVAIAVMGCIVNGPGEMADADFGYVGGAPGKIDLYVGKEVIKRAIPNENACDELVKLIKDYGRWVEKPVAEAELIAA